MSSNRNCRDRNGGPSMADRAVIARYQKRAAQMHELAAHEQNVDLRTSYLTLAKDWMRLADKEAQTDASAAS